MAARPSQLALLSYLVLLSCASSSMLWSPVRAAPEYAVINKAPNTQGGQRFKQEVKAQGILMSASQFIRQTFRYDAGDPSYPEKQVDKVTLYVDDKSAGHPAETMKDANGARNSFEIHLSESYVGSYSGDVGREVKGVLYHEMTHVWQWDGRGTADRGLFEGIADYIRLTASLAPPHWVKPGQGDHWNQGYDVTAYFLQYCESRKAGFVAALNAKLASGWDVSYFQELLGQSVDQLWQAYKQKYGM